jgi:DNA-binding CsgD family transcriptional regulator/PAS domain-containing protein
MDLDAPPALVTAVPALAELLNLDLACGYSMCRNADATGYAVDFFLESSPMIADAFTQRVVGVKGRVALYDPVRPESSQRNRILVHAWEQYEIHMGGVLSPVGLRGVHQVRALLCDGPVLLAWVGGFQHRRPTPASLELFEALVEPLRRRLALERRLGDAMLWASGLAASLEALSAPAFVVSSSGGVKHGNRAGIELLTRSPTLVGLAIRAAIRGEASAYAVTPLVTRGVPRHYLLIQRVAVGALEARLLEARARWKLTDRQVEVLGRLALGDANKDIAARFEMSARTVEQHVRDLTIKAKVDSRLRLVARLWSEG